MSTSTGAASLKLRSWSTTAMACWSFLCTSGAPPSSAARTRPTSSSRDLSLSRRHASFEWDDEGIWVEDLGSTNGTRLRGELVQRARLGPGDTVSLGGSVTASVSVASDGRQLAGIDSHEDFTRRLEDEVTRAHAFRRTLALVMIRAMSLDEGHVSRWAPRVRSELRDVDRMALYGNRSALVLLPETDCDVAVQVAKQVVSTDRLGEPPLVAGVATFPERGTSEALVDAARQAARRATLSSRVHVGTNDDDETERKHRSVVIASPRMREVYDLVRKIAASPIPVLILGETGSGKEVVAAAIHNGSPRRAGPQRSINCGAIPPTLIESILFGHERGAFTGAERSAPGLFEQADGGTVLLDEVGELSPAAQAALLRVLETKRLMRVGGTEEIEVDVRVIAATHRALETMADDGKFRRDLLYRLNTITLEVPPLRERPEEILALAELFLAEAARASSSPAKEIDDDARERLLAHSWPGNVRELRNTIERAVLVCRGDTITVEDLGERVRGAGPSGTSPTDYPGPLGGEEDEGDVAFKDRIREYETQLIVDALRKCEGNQTAAAKMLKMPLRTLVHKIRTYGIKKLYEV